MKRLLVVLGLLCLGFLAGCGKDPLVADVEAFDEVGAAVFRDTNTEIAEFNRKAAAVRTNEERAAVLGEVADYAESKAKRLAAFKPKTPEMRKIAEEVDASFAGVVAGARAAKTALQRQDQAALMAAMNTVRDGQQRLKTTMEAFVKLAKEKNVKLRGRT